jgi:hypothetical protein
MAQRQTTSTTRTSTRRAAPPKPKQAQEEPITTVPSDRSQTRITPEERDQMIATAAYFRAEARGFTPGQEHEDWMEAEAEIDQQINGWR